MKLSREIMSLRVTSKPLTSQDYLQLLTNGGRSNFWVGCQTCSS